MRVAGRSKRQAYALGATGGTPLPARQAAARKALTRFIAGLPHGVSGARYVPRALAVYVAPSDGQAQPGASEVVWPLKRNLATAGKHVPSGLNYRCISVGGADARTLLAALAQRQRGVALEHARGPRQALPADRAAAVPGRAQLRLAGRAKGVRGHPRY